jgi:hypothetical protein
MSMLASLWRRYGGQLAGEKKVAANGCRVIAVKRKRRILLTGPYNRQGCHNARGRIMARIAKGAPTSSAAAAAATVLAVIAMLATATVSAGPAERAGRLDKRLGAAEARGAWQQGSRADRAEDRFDRREDRWDRREDRRDRAVTRGPRDLAEDRRDRAENVRDRRENRRDRAADHR